MASVQVGMRCRVRSAIAGGAVGVTLLAGGCTGSGHSHATTTVSVSVSPAMATVGSAVVGSGTVPRGCHFVGFYLSYRKSAPFNFILGYPTTKGHYRDSFTLPLVVDESVNPPRFASQDVLEVLCQTSQGDVSQFHDALAGMTPGFATFAVTTAGQLPKVTISPTLLIPGQPVHFRASGCDANTTGEFTLWEASSPPSREGQFPADWSTAINAQGTAAGVFVLFANTTPGPWIASVACKWHGSGFTEEEDKALGVRVTVAPARCSAAHGRLISSQQRAGVLMDRLPSHPPLRQFSSSHQRALHRRSHRAGDW